MAPTRKRTPLRFLTSHRAPSVGDDERCTETLMSQRNSP